MLQTLRDAWGKWRESRHQHAVERALYKAGGGHDPSKPASEAMDMGYKSGLPPGGPSAGPPL